MKEEMMGTLIKLLVKYGPKAVAWAWNNTQRVLGMLARMSPEEVARFIAGIVGG